MSYRDGPLQVRSTDPELFTPVSLDEQIIALARSVAMSFSVMARDASIGFSVMARDASIGFDQFRLSSVTLAPPSCSNAFIIGGSS